jgi:hypothetical protein
MGLFKKPTSPHQTALAMVGARPGDRVLVAGRPEPGVVAELARVTGLSGQTLLAVDAASKSPYDAAASDAGVFVESVDVAHGATRLPATDGNHDVVVLHFDLVALDEGARSALAGDAMTALRPGGRVVIIEGRPKSGWFGSRPATLAADAVMAMLQAAGGVAVRTLGSADGISYFEARKAR